MTSDIAGSAMSTNKYKSLLTNKFDQICDQPNKFEGCLQVVGDIEFLW